MDSAVAEDMAAVVAATWVAAEAGPVAVDFPAVMAAASAAVSAADL